MSRQTLIAPMSDDALAIQRSIAVVAAAPILAAQIVAGSITEEQAKAIAYVFPQWAPDIAVTTNKVWVFRGVVYRCIQGHTTQTGWEPPSVPALWTPYRDPNVLAEWMQPLGSQDSYAKDAKVLHNGKKWNSIVANNVWEPGVSQWTEIV